MRRINPDRPLTQSERNRRFYLAHREKELERNQEYAKNNKKRINKCHRLNRHGMSVVEHDSLEKKQRGRCAICRKKFDGTPHIDHNHSCCPNLRSCRKCRRGLLCEDCNFGLGRFKDSVNILKKAIKYLRRHQ